MIMLFIFCGMPVSRRLTQSCNWAQIMITPGLYVQSSGNLSRRRPRSRTLFLITLSSARYFHSNLHIRTQDGETFLYILNLVRLLNSVQNGEEKRYFFRASGNLSRVPTVTFFSLSRRSSANSIARMKRESPQKHVSYDGAFLFLVFISRV